MHDWVLCAYIQCRFLLPREYYAAIDRSNGMPAQFLQHPNSNADVLPISTSNAMHIQTTKTPLASNPRLPFSSTAPKTPFSLSVLREFSDPKSPFKLFIEAATSSQHPNPSAAPQKHISPAALSSSHTKGPHTSSSKMRTNTQCPTKLAAAPRTETSHRSAAEAQAQCPRPQL